MISKKCFDCHGEHFGRDFDLTRFDQKTFDHNKTGFKLEGNHAKINCRDCHKKEFIVTKKLTERSKTFLGLSGKCSDCHEDVHRTTLGTDCAKCHNSESFKPAANFDHNKTDFNLSGKHNDIDCKKCHSIEVRNGKKFQNFVIGKKQNCSDCHSDVHKGKFGQNCEKCHSTVSFTKIQNLDKFNHDRTGFPLLGKHISVTCAKCHGNDLNSKPAHSKCIDCHSDYHDGQFSIGNSVRDCSGCHNVNSFTQSDFTIEMHNRTQFELTGSHLAVPCLSCHKSGEKLIFKFVSLECKTCHKNIHGEEINIQPELNAGCSSCHSTERWTGIIYTHKTKNFPLIGKHLDVKCKNCHFEKNTSLIVMPEAACTTCHLDKHNGQFENNSGNYCGNCHNFESWQPVLFDHNKSRFRLDGAHKNIECIKCHKMQSMGNKTFRNYIFKEVKCSVCHS